MPDHRTTLERTAPGARVEAPALKWSTHRLRDDPRRLPAVLGCILLASWAGGVLFGWGGAVVVAAALSASVADYLFPVHHTIGRAGVTTRCLFSRSEIRWEEVRRVWLAEDGVKLSPLRYPSRREAFRGVFLKFAGNEEQVLELIRRFRHPEDAT